MTEKDKAYLGIFGAVFAIQNAIIVIYLGMIVDLLRQLIGV